MRGRKGRKGKGKRGDDERGKKGMEENITYKHLNFPSQPPSAAAAVALYVRCASTAAAAKMASERDVERSFIVSPISFLSVYFCSVAFGVFRGCRRNETRSKIFIYRERVIF